MLDYAEPVTRLIDELKRLPGIGHKSAQRVAFHLLKATTAEAERLVEEVFPDGLVRSCERSEKVTKCLPIDAVCYFEGPPVYHPGEAGWWGV